MSRRNRSRKRRIELAKYTSIGGQALIEGIMMKSPEKTALAVRMPDKSIDITYLNGKGVRERYKILRVPIIRGVAGFVESMIQGYKAMMMSAERSLPVSLGMSVMVMVCSPASPLYWLSVIHSGPVDCSLRPVVSTTVAVHAAVASKEKLPVNLSGAKLCCCRLSSVNWMTGGGLSFPGGSLSSQQAISVMLAVQSSSSAAA